MEHFLYGAPPATEIVDGIAWRDTASYVEAKVSLGDAWVPVYILTVDDAIGAAVTCWDHQFDPILENLAQPQIEPVLRRLHPAWFACMDHARQERYGDGALLEFLDPDVMNRKWMIGVLFSSLETDRDARVAAAMEKVLAISLQVFQESSNKPSAFDYMRVAAAGALQGGAQGLAVADKIRAAAQWLPVFGG
ncbi:hypothetical protein [Leucobacter sp.]